MTGQILAERLQFPITRRLILHTAQVVTHMLGEEERGEEEYPQGMYL